MKEKEKSTFGIIVLGVLAIFGIFPLIFAFSIKFMEYAEIRSKKKRLALARKRFAAQVILPPKEPSSMPWKTNTS